MDNLVNSELDAVLNKKLRAAKALRNPIKRWAEAIKRLAATTQYGYTGYFWDRGFGSLAISRSKAARQATENGVPTMRVPGGIVVARLCGWADRVRPSVGSG